MSVSEARPREAAVEPSETSIRPTRLEPGWILLGAGALALAFLAGVLVGPVALRPAEVVGELVDRLPFVRVTSGLSARDSAILWQLRAPRVVLGGLVGAMLALSGAAYQGVFRNPLADPYLLGAAAGAGLGATLSIAYLHSTSSWWIDPLPLAAFGGAMVAVAATYALGRAASRTRTATTLILSGVAVASFFTSVQTFFQQRHADTLQRVYGWILGQLTISSWHDVVIVLPYLVMASSTILLHRRVLDVMSAGDDEASALGIDTARARLVVVAAASLGTAAAVAVSGLIGFVGIIVPHTIRLVAGSSYRVVLPLSVLFGAAFMMVMDLAARTILAPEEIPIGVITAFLGGPFFLFVLRRSKAMS